MRKYSILLVLVLCPMIVLADSAGPSIIGYDAVVISKNSNIPYNTKIHVYNEYDNTAMACHIKYANDCYDDDDRFNIPIKDIAVLKKEIVPKDLEKKDNEGTALTTINSKVLISNKNGLKLKKGPADVYGYYEQKIPYKTILNFKYGIEQSRFGLSWIYVDENGYKGWIEDSYDSDTFCILNDRDILTFANITIVDDNNNKVEIPKETVLNTVYLGYPTTFIEYKGTLGKIERDQLFAGYKGNLGYSYTIKSAELKSGGKNITAVPKGQKIKILYAGVEELESDNPYHYTGPICINENECYYYVEYNGSKGFIDSDNVIPLYYETEYTSINYETDMKFYNASCYNKLLDGNNFAEYSRECDTGKIIPGDKKIRLYYQTGEIIDKVTKKPYYVNFIKYQNEYGLIIEQADNPINSDPTDDNKEDDVTIVDNKNERIFTIIAYSLIAAGILSLTAYVTILFINKKKKTSAQKKVIDNTTEIKPIKKEEKSEEKKD